MSNTMLKTRICTHWRDYGFCKHGDDCRFAHGEHEKRYTRDCAFGFKCHHRHECKAIHTQEEKDYFDYLKHRDEFKQWLKMKNEPEVEEVQEVIVDEVILYPPPPAYQDVPEPEPIALLPPKAFQCIPVPKQDEERVHHEGTEFYKKMLKIDNQAKNTLKKKHFIRDYKEYIGNERGSPKRMKNYIQHYFTCKKCGSHQTLQEYKTKTGEPSLGVYNVSKHVASCQGH